MRASTIDSTRPTAASNLFFNVNDLLDTEPEDFFGGVYSSNVAAGTGLNVTGENRGRRYTLGVRLSF